MLARVMPYPLAALLVLLMAAPTAADRPTIVGFTASDPDNGDREYSAGDRVTLIFTPLNRRIQNAIASPSLTKAGIDALLTFTTPLGADYTGAWTNPTNIFDQLTITVVNPAGAGFADLAAYNLNVSCKAGVVTLQNPTGADLPCDENAIMPVAKTGSSDWGKGRPSIVNVTSQSAAPARLLAVNDTVRVEFGQDVDTARVDSTLGLTPSNGSAYVSAAAPGTRTNTREERRGRWRGGMPRRPIMILTAVQRA